jgi:geranylgeranyl diphosphate synthase type I
MDDVYLAAAPNIPDIQKITNVYQFKTGRYTIGLPLVAGHILAYGKTEDTEHLWNFSMNAGELFQIRDDELNLWGDPQITGKPIGSDIREGKKTLLIALLYAAVSASEKDQINTLFAKPSRNQSDVQSILSLMEKVHLQDVIAQRKHELSARSRECIQHLSWDASRKMILDAFLSYLESRES